MWIRHLAVITVSLAFCINVAAQGDLVEGEMFVADRGLMNNGSDGEIRRYTHTGALLQTLPSSGSGQIRGIETDLLNDVYVARGNSILVYRFPAYTPDAAAFASGNDAQDVAVHPTTGDIWCAFGKTPSDAEIRQYDANGNLLMTFTDPLFVHPRSIDFDALGNQLYIANAGPSATSGRNIIVIDTDPASATFGMIQLYADVSATGGAFSPIGIATDATGLIYVAGDWALDNEILQLVGLPGSAAIATFSNYGLLSGINAPSGMHADAYGNLYVAVRQNNSSTPGIYIYNTTAHAILLPALTGPEHKSPIGVAFGRDTFRIDFNSPDGVDANGVAKLDVSQSSPNLPSVVNVDLFAPRYANRAYGFAMSVLNDATCAGGNPTLPFFNGIPLALGEPRLLPLNFDALFTQTLQIVSQQNGPLSADVFGGCGGSIPGSGTFFNGVLDPSGNATGFVQLPTLPCIPVGTVIYIGVAGAVIDATTAPLGLALISNRPTCLRVEITP